VWQCLDSALGQLACSSKRAHQLLLSLPGSMQAGGVPQRMTAQDSDTYTSSELSTLGMYAPALPACQTCLVMGMLGLPAASVAVRAPGSLTAV
jgi:hypothetical protein